MNASAFPPPRVAPNLLNALGGVVRLEVYRLATPAAWAAPLSLLAVVVLLLSVTVHEGNRDAFMSWSTGFYLTFLVPVLAFLSGAGAIREEMKGNAVDYILTRPVPRWAFLVFRYLAQWLCTQLSYAPIFFGLLAVGFYRQVPGLVSAIPLLMAGQLLVVTVFLAFGFLAGVLTSRYMILGVFYGSVVEVGISAIPIQLNQLSMTHHVRTFLQSLDSGISVVALGVEGPAIASVFLLGMTLLQLSCAALLFAGRELIGTRSAES